MNPTEVKGWKCGGNGCGRQYACERVAAECCICSICKNPVDKKNGDYDHLHRHCADVRDKERERKRFETCERVGEADVTGMVYSPDLQRHNDGYFHGTDEILEYIEDELAAGDLEFEDVPTHCYCTTSKSMTIDAQDFIEKMLENSYEDAYEDLNGIKELDEAVVRFNAANSGVLTYFPDFKRIVVIDRSKFKTESHK